MPLNISVNKKKRPAWSSALSLLSSHLCGLGRRKFEGGGPEGVAYVRGDVEKAATKGDGEAAKARDERISWALGRQSMVSGLVEAIVL